MPHFPHTPEALLDRNDSRNVATTCKGITSTGRPCRRSIASAKSSGNGSVAKHWASPDEGNVERLYCWQHKEQAKVRDGPSAEQANRAGEGKGERMRRLYPLQEKSSIDTLVYKLGLSRNESKSYRKPVPETHRQTLPEQTEATEFAERASARAPYADKYGLGASAPRRPEPNRRGFWASLCCTRDEDDDYVEMVRHKKRIARSREPAMSTVPMTPPRSALVGRKIPSVSVQTPTGRWPMAPVSGQVTVPTSLTAALLSLIPPNLSPETTSALLAELVKPISPHDDEGYIYIFWLTPQTNAKPPDSTTRSLLSPGATHHDRRLSDVLSEYADEGASNAGNSTKRNPVSTLPRTIMLKIGRANNITRRMNEWQRQCGYALNLVRWYPYISSSSTPSPPHQQHRQPKSIVRKVSTVKRVERLIHLELADKQIKRDCTACGKVHREWFEVSATRRGVREVDAAVRRWVGWAERSAGGS